MTKVIRSSGNVFRDLGLGQEEAEHLRLRSTLMGAVRQLMADRHLTQAKAASLFGVTQPRMSDLVRGKIERFSIDGLIEMLSRAGVHVEMRVVTARTRKTARVA
jgi:predicted XRE-type DNA-binding protein